MEFKRVLHCFDEDGDGKILPGELRRCLQMIGEDLSDEEVELLFGGGGDGDAAVGFDEVLELVGLEGEGEGEGGEEDEGRSYREMREAFGVFEMEGTGCITPKSLRRALSGLGRSTSVEDCQLMIRRFDADGDGVLSFEEFRDMIL